MTLDHEVHEEIADAVSEALEPMGKVLSELRDNLDVIAAKYHLDSYDVRSHVRENWGFIFPPGDWASLTSIRAALSDIPRGEVDEALLQLAQEPGVLLNPDPQPATLTEADRDAALHVNGQAQHLIAIS